MMKLVFIDDEPLALRQLELYAGKTPDIEVLGAFTSASEALPVLERADVLFTDIDMPDVNGLDFVRSLQSPPLIVFTTAYAQFALDGFRANASDYLLKPFSLSEFQRSVAKVRHFWVANKAAEREGSVPGLLYFKTEYKTVSVPLDDIRYVESMSEYVKIWLRSQAHPLVVLYSLKRLVELLPEAQFMRIHRSYIISTRLIRESTSASVTMDNGLTLPVGDSYRQAFREFLAKRIR